jgi:hypothetical protein
VISPVLRNIALDAEAGHVVDIERVWPADPTHAVRHRAVCACDWVGRECTTRRGAVRNGNDHRRYARLPPPVRPARRLEP